MDARKVTIVAMSALAIAGVGFAGRTVAIAPAHAACLPTDHVNGSTAQDAKRGFARAGYPNVQNLVKGCDNVWHGITNKGGQPIRVALEPGGKVFPEGN
jgi:hypothetical protein